MKPCKETFAGLYFLLDKSRIVWYTSIIMDTRYAEIEPNKDGTFAVFNNVTGLCVLESCTEAEAKGLQDMLHKHYAAIEKLYS